MRDLAMRMFANLDEEMFQIFVSFLISQTVIWGSGCSGSECPSFVSTLHTTGKYCKMKQSTIDEMVGATGSVDSQTA